MYKLVRSVTCNTQTNKSKQLRQQLYTKNRLDIYEAPEIISDLSSFKNVGRPFIKNKKIIIEVNKLLYINSTHKGETVWRKICILCKESTVIAKRIYCKTCIANMKPTNTNLKKRRTCTDKFYKNSAKRYKETDEIEDNDFVEAFNISIENNNKKTIASPKNINEFIKKNKLPSDFFDKLSKVIAKSSKNTIQD